MMIITAARKIKNKGFSLVELAIVIVVIGLVIAMGMKLLTPVVERTKRTGTNETLDAAVAAVIGYAEVNNKLPLVGDGIPDSTYDEFVEVVRNSKDVWGNDLIYRPDSNLTLDGSVCGRSDAAITIRKCLNAACTSIDSTTEDVAFVIVSSGPNMNIQTDTTAVLPATFDIYNQGLVNIDDYAAGLNRPEPYSDIVRWVVLPELRVRAGCFGSPLKLLTLEIPSGFVLTSYSAEIFADEGVAFTDGGDADSDPDYQWCVTSAAPGGLAYECNGALAASASCSIDPAAGTWQQCTSLEISGDPTANGAFSLPVYVKDNAGNITNRTYGMSISQVSGLNVCNTYRVWNNGGSNKDFQNNGCYTITNGAEITTAGTGGQLGNAMVINKYAENNATCVTLFGTEPYALSYIQAIFADNDADCCINFDQSDKACP